MSRKRFNRNIIANSDSYKWKSHLNLLRENHKSNEEYFTHINATVVVERKVEYYTKCFGKLIKITKEEALRLDTNLVITF